MDGVSIHPCFGDGETNGLIAFGLVDGTCKNVLRVLLPVHAFLKIRRLTLDFALDCGEVLGHGSGLAGE